MVELTGVCLLYRQKKLCLVSEVSVDCATGDASRFSHFVERGAIDAFGMKNPPRGINNLHAGFERFLFCSASHSVEVFLLPKKFINT